MDVDARERTRAAFESIVQNLRSGYEMATLQRREIRRGRDFRRTPERLDTAQERPLPVYERHTNLRRRGEQGRGLPTFQDTAHRSRPRVLASAKREDPAGSAVVEPSL